MTEKIVPNLLAWMQSHADILGPMVMSAAIAALRVMYGGGRLRETVFEAILCGVITITILSGLNLIGVPETAGVFAGGMIGFLGVKKVQGYAEKLLDRRLG